MKALFALLFGISVIAISICLHVRKTIDRKSLTIMFGLAIVGGLAIANYDVLKRLKWLGMEIETARNEIQGVKTDAINEIQKEVDAHKEAISILMRSANDLSDKLDKQKTLAEALVEKAKGLEAEIEKDQKQLSGIKTDVLIAKQATQSAKSATEELGKILTRIAYFQVITKGQFGTAQAKKAIQRINGDLNQIVNMMIPDPKERSDFVNGLINELK